MKVIILVFCEYPGGSAAAFHAQRMGIGLRAGGAEVLVVSYRQIGDARAPEGVDDRGVPFQAFALRRRFALFPSYIPLAWSYGQRAASLLDAILREKRWDTIIYYGRSWLAARPIEKVARRHGVPVIPYQVEWHNIALHLLATGEWVDTELYRRRILPHRSAMIGISRLWKIWGDAHRLLNVVVPAFADLNVTRPPPERPRTGKPFHIVYVGGWGKRELPVTLFEGLERAIDLGVDVRLTVVGRIGKSRMERSAMRDFSRRSELKARTTFVGWLTGKPLADQLAAAHAFVLLREENRETQALFPTRLPEYLTIGTPVILSQAGDLPLYLEHRKSAWFIPPGHAPQELARAIEHLSLHDEERRAIGRGGWEVAALRLSCERLGTELLTFLDKVADGSARDATTNRSHSSATLKTISRGST